MDLEHIGDGTPAAGWYWWAVDDPSIGSGPYEREIAARCAEANGYEIETSQTIAA